MRILYLLLLAAPIFAQTYNIITVAPDAGASAVGRLRFAEKSNSTSRHFLSFEGPTTLGANVRYKLDGTTTGGCLILQPPSGGINIITSANCGTPGAIVFPSGTPAPQIDGTGLGAAINFNGSSSVNGNIVLNPGGVAGAGSVFINTPRLDWPGLILQNATGTTTDDVFQIRDSSGAAQVRITGSGNATSASSLFLGLPTNALSLVGPSVVAQNVIASMSDPINASGISIAATPSSGGADLSVFKTGTGTLLPLRFFRNPTELARFATTNQFLIGLTSTDVSSGVGSVIVSDTVVSASAAANASTVSIAATASGSFLSAGKTGSGTLQPLIFMRNPSEVARFDTSNRFLLGRTADDGTGSLLQVAGAQSISGGILPLFSTTYSLGGSSNRWLKTWTGDLDVSGHLILTGVGSPQIDATGTGAALNINGASATNGNIVLNPGPVTGLSSVQINGANNSNVQTEALIVNDVGGAAGSGITMKHGGTFDSAWQSGTSASFDVVGNASTHLFVLDQNGITTKYNGASTAGMGVAPIYTTADFTNVSSSLGSTSVLIGGSTPPAGMYRVSIYVACRSTGTGSVNIDISYNDGITSRTLNGVGVPLSSTAQNFPYTALIYSNGSGISYASTYFSSGAYDVHISFERVS